MFYKIPMGGPYCYGFNNPGGGPYILFVYGFNNPGGGSCYIFYNRPGGGPYIFNYWFNYSVEDSAKLFVSINY